MLQIITTFATENDITRFSLSKQKVKVEIKQ